MAALVLSFSSVFINNGRMEKICITVHVEPSAAIVTTDGRRYVENPVTLEGDPDTALRTIQANADGAAVRSSSYQP
jgi:antitoxin (DNA-binding transcriptional repressor) of toxin-antitoxin stability system